MTRRSFLGSAAATFAAVQTRRPNIVWIMADDLGVGDLGCYGQKIIRTPNIDRMAAEGMRFTRAYAGCTVCAPSRSVLMTGRHMGHTSIRSNPGGVPILDSDVTVAEILRRQGYRSGGFGKWGLGDMGTEGTPTRQGFDEWYGYLHQVHAHWFYPEYLIDGDARSPLPRGTYSHDAIAARCLDFIRGAARARTPFFCYVPFTIPHLELLVPDDSIAEYRGKVEDKPYVDPRKHYGDQPESRAAYAGMVSRMDRDVGRILALLAELGLDRDTIVFFTSDNGGATRLWGDDYFRSTAGLRGRKTDLYEGGIRTPLIARWPGRIRPGVASNRLTYFADFLPTACQLAGAPVPRDTDGVSLLPVLEGRKQREHAYLYWELPRHDARTGEFRREAPMQALRQGDWKIHRPKPDGPLELYNLAQDPYEEKDLAAARPDVVERLARLMAAARTEPRPQKNPA